ncbi:MAG TPA: lytic transglycosylase domain-containing protein [Methylomirabilota bacterium]|nr:lytic transglycosylase domain-containing protein [Methylomirabilota bacterium]
MKVVVPIVVLGWLLGTFVPAAAQEVEVDPDEVVAGVEQWMNENLDEAALEALGVDTGRVRQFLADVRQRFQGVHVYDLAAVREVAEQIRPVLESYEETQPLAAWLRAHLDYFDVSRELRDRVAVTATNKMRLPPPSPELQRSVWVKVVESRPVPPAAASHLDRLKRIFVEEKVPAELVWLAEVESSFDPRARSPAGAAGLFQLMPATARSLDLSVGFWRDERLQPEKNGRAAARYLRELYRRFGDWRLALAAYNCGPTRVADLLRKHRAGTYDGISAHLPAETQLYVPKVEAILRRREGVRLDRLRLPAG